MCSVKSRLLSPRLNESLVGGFFVSIDYAMRWVNEYINNIFMSFLTPKALNYTIQPAVSQAYSSNNLGKVFKQSLWIILAILESYAIIGLIETRETLRKEKK